MNQLSCSTAANVLRDALQQTSFSNLVDDPTRGQVAAELWETLEKWSSTDPIVETGLFNELPDMMIGALRHHGRPTESQWFEMIGRRLALAAADYLISSHRELAERLDAEIAREQGEK